MRKAKCIILSLMLIAAVLMTSGCQLARDEKEFSQDRLVGISVRLVSGFGSRAGYFDRRQPHEPDGAMVWLKTDYTETGEPMIGPEYDSDWFEPAHLSIHVKDEDEEHYLETTIYLAGAMLPDNPLLEMEHVYRREDGTLYAIDNGSNYSGHMDGLGLTVSQSQTVTGPDGKRKQETTTIKLNIKYEEVVLSAEAVEMKGTGEELMRHALTGQEELWVSPGAEWLLIEEKLGDGTIRRTAVNGPLDGEYFSIRKANEQGVCIRESYKIHVPGTLSDQTKPG